jgi:hypothetical protein
MRNSWPCFLGLWLACGGAGAADISVSGNWSKTVNRDNLAAGAGSNLVSTIESPAATATLNIINTAGATWTVRVAKSNVSWPANVGVAVKRTTNGSGSGTISSGTSYLAVDSTANTFFSGTGDRTGIEIQLRLYGVSIGASPGLYSLAITYSVQSP